VENFTVIAAQNTEKRKPKLGSFLHPQPKIFMGALVFLLLLLGKSGELRE